MSSIYPPTGGVYTGTAPITVNASNQIGIPNASATVTGALLNTDWVRFDSAAGGGLTGLSGDVTTGTPVAGVAPATVVRINNIPFSGATGANKLFGFNAANNAIEYKELSVGTTGTDFNIAQSAGAIAFNLPDASATARGVMSTGTQTIAGPKTFNGAMVLGSTLAVTGAQTFTGASAFNGGATVNTNSFSFTGGAGVSITSAGTLSALGNTNFGTSVSQTATFNSLVQMNQDVTFAAGKKITQVDQVVIGSGVGAQTAGLVVWQNGINIINGPLIMIDSGNFEFSVNDFNLLNADIIMSCPTAGKGTIYFTGVNTGNSISIDVLNATSALATFNNQYSGPTVRVHDLYASNLANTQILRQDFGVSPNVSLVRQYIKGATNSEFRRYLDNNTTNTESIFADGSRDYKIGGVSQWNMSTTGLVTGKQHNVTSIVSTGSRIYANNTLQMISKKAATLTAGTWTTIATYSGGAGQIKKIWLALNACDPAKCYIRIVFDGSPGTQPAQFGTDTASSFTLANSLACDILFSAGFGSTNYWSNSSNGCNRLVTGNSGSMGGYVSFDMPFISNFTVQIFNNSVTGTYWSQVFYEASSVSVPYYFYMKPWLYSSVSSSTTVFKECPLMSVAGGSNPIVLKHVKIFADPAGNSIWYEGKFRGYLGGAGLTVGTQYSYTAATPSTLSYYNQQAGVTQISESSGTEDLFMSSWNWTGLTTYNNEFSGTVLNASGTGTGNLTAYINFKDSSIGAPASTRFTFTWTCGDQNAATGTASVNFITGIIGYYT